MADAHDDDGDDVDVSRGSSLSNCAVCNKLSVADNRMLTEYIAKLLENTTTPHMVQEIKSFIQNLMDRHSADAKNHMQIDQTPPTNHDIETHLRLCIIPRDRSLNKVVIIHDISEALSQASSENAKIILMKLLVQTLALDLKKSV